MLVLSSHPRTRLAVFLMLAGRVSIGNVLLWADFAADTSKPMLMEESSALRSSYAHQATENGSSNYRSSQVGEGASSSGAVPVI